MFSACFVIPNYNHSIDFEGIIARLCLLKLPIIIVNDGSDKSTAEMLEKLALENELVTTIHLPENQGKGSAVMTGILHAGEQGYSHALQIDADGQHNLDDAKAFFEISERSPQAVICGCPIFDDSIPLGRFLGRYITHFWVWVETLSFTIKDSMCGFRVYPVAAAVRVIKNNNIGRRMDFDTEILVRLYWDSVEIISESTKVIYPENGVSHFNFVKDNCLLIKMHIMLVFGMLIRIPNLLMRKLRPGKNHHWSSLQERGSSAGLDFLLWVYRIFGRRTLLFLLHPVILYFIASSRAARHASKNYQVQLKKFQKQDGKVGWKKIYAHFYEFGVTAIDKIGCWAGEIRNEDVVINGAKVFDALVVSEAGAVFIGSHLGNLELCRALGQKGGRKKINAIVYNKHAASFQGALASSDAEAELNLIHVEKMGIDTAILLKQKIDAGELVVIVGDRTPVNSVGRVQYVNFLDKPAAFSEGPFILAGLLDCPVYLIFGIKEKGAYNIYLEHFAETLKFPRKRRHALLAEKIQEYADRLAFYCVKAPLQWFNFYDFWRKDSE